MASAFAQIVHQAANMGGAKSGEADAGDSPSHAQSQDKTPSKQLNGDDPTDPSHGSNAPSPSPPPQERQLNGDGQPRPSTTTQASHSTSGSRTSAQPLRMSPSARSKSSYSTFARSAKPGTPSARTGLPSSLDITYTPRPSRAPSAFMNGNTDSDPDAWRTESPDPHARDFAQSRSQSRDSGPAAANGHDGQNAGKDLTKSSPPKRPHFSSQESEFRSALEYADPEQREVERREREKRERKRESRNAASDDSWNPIKWFTEPGPASPAHESPKEEKPWLDWAAAAVGVKKEPGTDTIKEEDETVETQENGTEPEKEKGREKNKEKGKERAKEGASAHGTPAPSAPNSPRPPAKTPNGSLLPRSVSSPHRENSSSSQQQQGGPKDRPMAPKWNRLRSLLPTIVDRQRDKSSGVGGQAVISPHEVNIADELMNGGLSSLMLRLWFERDEKDRRRVPVLLHRLKIRVSDSLYPLSGHKAVFRIECEYANGAARWVIYRQLRDFLSLHTHYTVSNAYNRNVEGMPDFPTTSLPYFKFLKKQAKEKGKEEVGHQTFARMQREALENYLLGLIRCVMFHPTVNRLAGFLEISALSIMLAQSGGSQYKAGFLRIEASGNKGAGFGRRGASWKERKRVKWCAVRESYLVVMEEQGETVVWDTFLLDPDFKIERPTRYYRQGLNLLHSDAEAFDNVTVGADNKLHTAMIDHSSRHSIGGTLKHSFHKLERTLHLRGGHSKHNNDKDRHRKAASMPAVNQQHGDDDIPQSSPETSSVSSSEAEEEAEEEEEHAAHSPMLDPSTNTNPLLGEDHDQVDVHPTGGPQPDGEEGDQNGGDGKSSKSRVKSKIGKNPVGGNKKQRKSNEVSKHTFYIENSQMRLKLYAKNERQMLQWIAALEKVAGTSHYTGQNRFESFAPIRLNVAAQWLVDGRDYFWNLSRAILLAKESIYIHDWWLSPELLMRRPGKEKYRLDKLLQRKAREGVKIFVILYQEVSSRTTPTDSNYTKQTLTALHENIMVQRSPSHLRTGTFYWAHHEKMCVIDEAIAFMGGLDLCFGRWDTPQHVLVDDAENGPEGSETIWPGKDYSNPRIKDFYALHQPFEEMYDRSKIPRMPWHDVSMQIVGQPARDLARHFVQRWNYLLRIKSHSRVMPFLLPPPEFMPGELTRLGLTGTCELQICRSAGPWSLGTPNRIEHSIQNAYLKAIQLSEHFVYIENQFFITSTVVGDVKIENRIGDAIVARAIRAHREGTPWKCCIVIPLLPGFTFPVDHSDASAIRIIIECQNRTICRGPHSIYGRLRKEGIDPDDYITVFSLRNWAKFRGDVLTTELVYIHGKVCIVDDRLAIIGSANINERSQRGDRDSELAAIIRDTDMLDGTMGGKPFKVGRFAHTLRVRLMREHIGVDVDAMYEEDLMANEPTKPEHEQDTWDPDKQQQYGREEGVTHVADGQHRSAGKSLAHDVTDGLSQAIKGGEDMGSKDIRLFLHKHGLKGGHLDATAGDEALKDERTTFTRDGKKELGFSSAQQPTMEEKLVREKSPLADEMNNMNLEDHNANSWDGRTEDGSQLYGAPADAAKNDAAPPNKDSNVSKQEEEAPKARAILRKHLGSKLNSSPWVIPLPRPEVDPDGFDDPVSDAFWKDVWVAAAVYNTEVFRKVFHAIPDDLITTWKQYKEFIVHHERLNKPVKDEKQPPVARMPSETADADAPGDHNTITENNQDPDGRPVDKEGDKKSPPPSSPSDDETAHETNDGTKPQTDDGKAHPNDHDKQPSVSMPDSEKDKGDGKDGKDGKRRYAKGDEPFEKWERDEMEKLLGTLCGQLVLYPTRFLEGEDVANNFLFNADRLLPMPIYD